MIDARVGSREVGRIHEDHGFSSVSAIRRHSDGRQRHIDGSFYPGAEEALGVSEGHPAPDP
jgi:hypothetical protein